MSIENVNRCDDCGTSLTEGDEIFCVGCFKDLQKQIAELEEKIIRWEEANKGMKEQKKEADNDKE